MLLILFERLAESTGPRLKIDREKGIIYGVKVAGRFSKNTHGVPDVDGTEYARSAYEKALPMYEGMKVRVDHPADRSQNKPNPERSVYDSFGVLQDPRLEGDSSDYGVYADLHYLKKHPLAESVLDDVERGLGVYGLSHHAYAAKDSIRGRRYVIEQIGDVKSVDLVDKPATNKNLWESEKTTVKYTLKQILESRKAKFSAPRVLWTKRLLEDDSYSEPMTAETEDMPADADPADAMKAAFRSAGDQILDGIFDGSVDADEGFKKLKELFKTHGKLTQKEEPEAPVEESEDDDAGGDDKGDKRETAESLRTENDKLKAKLAVRELCEAEEFTPTKTQLKALELFESDVDRKAFIREAKLTAKPGTGGPRSRAAGGKPLMESQGGGNNVPQTAEGQLALLRRG